MRHWYIILTLNKNTTASKGCRHGSSPPPKKFNLLVKWWFLFSGAVGECTWIIDYLQKGQTLMGSIMPQLNEAVKSKGKMRAGVLLLQDNAPVHTAQVEVTWAEICDSELLPHAPLSDLALSNFYLFPNWNPTCRAAVLSVTMTMIFSCLGQELPELPS